PLGEEGVAPLSAAPDPLTPTAPLGEEPVAPETPPALLFSSEIKPIAFSGLVERRPNDRSIFRYLRFRVHDDTPDTFFEGIYQLLAGQILEADQQGIRVSSYTSLQDELLALSLTESHTAYSPQQTQRFFDTLKNSVRLRLQADYPIGTALSGGLDSTSIAALIDQLMAEDPASTTAIGDRQRIFSAVFPNSLNDEERYIDAFIRDHSDAVEVYKCAPQVNEFTEDFDDFIYTIEQPIISTGPYAQYQVMRLASTHVRAFLDGQGADEMMAGYVPYYFVYLRQLLSRRHFLRFTREAFFALDKIVHLLLTNFRSRLRGKRSWEDKSFIKSSSPPDSPASASTWCATT
ncbi:MAG: asparagine synthase-related protein, partial [Coriobacteriia bacterium]|nr:asparagine synthase-related protein [Coriobacteriia bacterium]